MTMSWMETIRFLGLDLQVATVLAVATVDAAARVLKSVSGRLRHRSILGYVRCRTDRVPGLYDPAIELKTAHPSCAHKVAR